MHDLYPLSKKILQEIGSIITNCYKPRKKAHSSRFHFGQMDWKLTCIYKDSLLTLLEKEEKRIA